MLVERDWIFIGLNHHHHQLVVCELIVVVSIKKEWKALAYSRYAHASDSFLRIEAAAVSRLVL